MVHQKEQKPEPKTDIFRQTTLSPKRFTSLSLILVIALIVCGCEKEKFFADTTTASDDKKGDDRIGDPSAEHTDNRSPQFPARANRVARVISANTRHACAIFSDNSMKCWGSNTHGQIGLGRIATVGIRDNEMGDDLPVVDLGTNRYAVSVSCGGSHTCAHLDNGKLKCWGDNDKGQLGISGDNRGDEANEMGDNLPYVELGSDTLKQVSAGNLHTCVLFENGKIKCWGDTNSGALGRMTSPTNGPSIPYVDLGTSFVATHVIAGFHNTCALSTKGEVKCWGLNNSGGLGIGDGERNRGDHPNEMGDFLPTVNLGTELFATAIHTKSTFTCALLNNGKIKCWGSNDEGELGQGDTISRGRRADEMGDNLKFIDLGTTEKVTQITMGQEHACALLESGRAKCWGRNHYGQLGQGNTASLGNTPFKVGTGMPFLKIENRYPIIQLSGGGDSHCALFIDGSVKCWGYWFGPIGQGKKGFGNNMGDAKNEIGDDLPVIDFGS